MNGKLLTEQSLMPCLDITEIPHIIVVNLVSEMKHFTGSKMQICFLFWIKCDWISSGNQLQVIKKQYAHKIMHMR